MKLMNEHSPLEVIKGINKMYSLNSLLDIDRHKLYI